MAATILIADDEPGIRSTLSRLLRQQGFNVLEAEDGMAALRLASVESVDVLISDVRMPNLSGLGLAARLCVPTILMSGYGADAHLTEGYVWLQKPFSTELLLTSIHRLLS